MGDYETRRQDAIDERRERLYGPPPEPLWYCPYPGCPFVGTEDEVDDHRADNHRDEAQEGSNLRQRRAT